MYTRSTSPWWLPGAALVLFGVAIVVFPELLALLVASAFIIAGVSWLTIASAARKLTQQPPSPIYVYRDRRDYGTF